MNVLTMIALAVAGAALLMGILAWRTARDAKILATKTALRITNQALLPARAIPTLPGDTGAGTEAPVGASGAADPGPPEVAMPKNERTATLAVRRGETFGQALPTNQGTGTGLIGLFVTNAGPGVAHDLRLCAAFPDGALRTSDRQPALASHKEAILYVQVVPRDFESSHAVALEFRVAYRDGNGDHELVQGVRVEGGWSGPWKTYFSDDEPGSDIGSQPAAPARGRLTPPLRH